MTNTLNEWTVLSMLEWATNYFEERRVKSPRLSIEWLLSYVLEIKRLDLYINYDRPLANEQLQQLKPLIKRRAVHEPLQYITGEADFYGYTFKVSKHVLIPRQETEQLVELIRNNHRETETLHALDVGTGSGCIPITLKNLFSDWNITAVDISEAALEIAKENALQHNANIDYILGDLFDKNFLKQNRYNIIVSNPPYVLREEEELLDEEVKNFEPHIALFCESTTKIFEAIENLSATHLAEDGTVYLEVHENHAHEVADIFSNKGWTSTVEKDLDDRDRFVIANH